MSTKSALQILPLKDEDTFCFSNLLIIGLCNSSAKSWFDIISLLTASPEVFYWKTSKASKQDLFDIYHILDF